ncbi:cytochrome c oxidase subunit II [Abyssogena phaseoliformis symbiont OG214]|uniref:cupredoxin domain-containing protein n=1 Tax=Abyssogena phaseoliformis symbiont TaxID=596095 RepID=UPI001915FC93|nr:cupredoxin domain-containing protein [Abyssogena phaseoliformis symbiont]MBW5289157.1 Cytochrome c oxidase (B(O/a)3-type) chain II [Candidatus Ruthia sp. Apha_13_S6]BBB22541.1 cytochrome c oxidase subunit II [Abyssogena phaseoliformis symbiont OG214]
MHIDSTEKKWIYISVVMTIGIVALLTFSAVSFNIHPPSNVEKIDSNRLHLGGEFSEDNLGVKQNADGSYSVTMIAARYGFYPQRIEVPVNTPIKIRIASFDVLHGIHAPFTNFNTMIVPGYISEVNTTFTKAGEYPLFCNEFCGLGHDHMWSKLIVSEAEK